MFYKPLPSCVTIHQSSIHGLGLFATEFIKAGTNLGITHVYNENFPDNYIRLPLGGFINDSRINPNCEFIGDKQLSLQTIKDINKGEELTAFYTLYDPSTII